MVAGIAMLAGILLMAGTQPVLAGEAGSAWTAWKKSVPFELAGEIEGSAQIIGNRGANSPTFDEYRDLDTLGTVPFLRLQGEDQGRTRFLETGGANLTRMDANYYLNAGLYNYLQFNFEFDRTPHVIAHNAQTIYSETSPGVFRITSGGALATALNAVSSTPTAAQRSAVVTAVNNLLNGTGLGFQTDAAKFGLAWLPLPELELSLGYSYTNREGRVPWGTVIGSPGSNAVELAAPRDERFHEVKAGAEYVRDWYQLRLNYTFSQFENDVNKIEWDNPCGSGSGGCRNAAGIGRYSTMPDNYAHTVSGGAGINLPWWRTRLTGGLSYSLQRQDETFLPYTSLAGAGNTTDAGASSPDAKLNVLHANLNLTTRPLKNVTATTRYRYYELDNETPVHTFTSILSGGGDATPATTSKTTEPIAFRKQNAGQEVAWRLLPQVTLKAAYEWEHWNRHDREADSSNEQTVRGVVDVRPRPWLLGRFSYSHGVRTIHAGGYEPLGGNATALPQFRKFDEADRTRDKGDIFVQVTPVETVTLSGSFFVQNDHYFNTSYGLQEAKAFGWSGDVSWAPREWVSLYAGYAHDEYQSREQSCNISSAPPAVCNVLDTFFVRPRDLLDSVRAGVNLTVIPKRLDLSLGYSFNFGRSKFAVAGEPGGAAAGEPKAVDDVENLFHVVNVVARLFLTPNWTLKLGYQYERYEEKDFTTNGVSPALAALPVLSAADARSIILGAQHPPYEAHIVAFSLGYKF